MKLRCLAVSLLLCLPASAAERQAAACPASAREACDRDWRRCERDCADLTLCWRRCCETYHECLTSQACELHGPACPR